MYYRFDTYLEYKKFISEFTDKENIPKLVCWPYQCSSEKYVVFVKKEI